MDIDRDEAGRQGGAAPRRHRRESRRCRVAGSSGTNSPAKRFHGGTSTGSACAPNSAVRRARPAPDLAATTVGRPAGRIFALLAVPRVVGVPPAMLQHRDAGRAGQRVGQPGRARAGITASASGTPAARRSSRSSCGVAATASSSRHHSVATRPASPQRSSSSTRSGQSRGLRLRGDARRGTAVTAPIVRGSSSSRHHTRARLPRQKLGGSSAPIISAMIARRARRAAGVERDRRRVARGGPLDRRRPGSRRQLALAHQFGGAQRGEPLGPQQLLGLAFRGERHQHGAGARGEDIEHGIVAGLADRDAAARATAPGNRGANRSTTTPARRVAGARRRNPAPAGCVPASSRHGKSARQPARRAASAARQQRQPGRAAAGRDQDLAVARRRSGSARGRRSPT